MNKVTTFPWLKIYCLVLRTLLFLNYESKLVLEQLLSDAVCSLILTTDKTLDLHAKILTLPPVGIVKNLKSGWNIKQIFNQSPLKYFSP